MPKYAATQHHHTLAQHALTNNNFWRRNYIWKRRIKIKHMKRILNNNISNHNSTQGEEKFQAICIEHQNKSFWPSFSTQNHFSQSHKLPYYKNFHHKLTIYEIIMTMTMVGGRILQPPEQNCPSNITRSNPSPIRSSNTNNSATLNIAQVI